MRRPRLAALVAGFTAALGVVIGLAAPAQASTTNYVALGDSYASGVGADSYTSESGSCQRSTNAYPAVWAATYLPASYRSVACSGATTSNVINSQLSALSSSTNLVSLTVGGNDVGFSSIMTACVLYGEYECIAAVNAAEVKAQTELPGKLDQVYSGIRSRSPYAKVVVTSYPEFYQLNMPFCVGLTERSRAKINEGINILDGVIKTAVTKYGFRFADVRSIFVGHQLCSGDKWLHALNWLNIGISYHPNKTGQRSGYYPVFRNTVAY